MASRFLGLKYVSFAIIQFMANLIPGGIDGTSGQKKPLASSDTLVNADGSPITGLGACTVLSIQTQASGDDLTYAMPGNTLANDGERLHLIAVFENNTGSSVAFSLKFDGTNTGGITSTTNGEIFTVVTEVIRLSATSQYITSTERSLAGVISSQQQKDTATLSGTVNIVADRGDPDGQVIALMVYHYAAS